MRKRDKRLTPKQMRKQHLIKTKYELVLLGMFLLLFSSCNSKKESINPEVMDITESIYATGFIKSENQYEVFAPTTGIIEEIFVSEGALIKKGDTIFRIENKSQELAIENARLTSTTSDYSINESKLLAAQDAIEIARKTLTYDSLQYQRQKELWKDNIGSKIELEKKELKFQSSQTELEQRRTNYEDLRRQIKLASAQSKNNLKIAQLTQENFIVKSEVDGVVYKLNKEEGELYDGREPIAIIGTELFVIEFSVDEKDIIKVEKDQQVMIRMDSYDSEIFEARIIAIEPMMNSRTRSFQAEAVFLKKPAKLYPNLTVEANIVIQTKENALTIPRGYLVNDSSVLLMNGEMQTIKIGLMDFEKVEVLSGIDENTAIQLPVE
jgi:multidrug efflux pump subunit AcrA (membrane-fusion protein)